MTIAELVDYICAGSSARLAGPLARWCAESARFRAFAERYRAKIRKKVRAAGDPDAALDLAAELEVAVRLLADRRFALEYEPYAADKVRGPDFGVLFRAQVPCTIEVTRLRPPAPGATEARPARAEKLATTLCTKLGQLPPSIANVLVLVTEPGHYAPADLAAALRLPADAAARHDDAYFTRRGLRGARDFPRQMARLSAVLLWPAAPAGGGPPALWLNPQARHPLPADLRRALERGAGGTAGAG